MNKLVVFLWILSITVFLSLSAAGTYSPILPNISATSLSQTPPSLIPQSGFKTIGTLAFIVSSSADNTRRNLYMVDTNGNNFNSLGHVDFEVSDMVAWSPDGKRLAMWGSRGVSLPASDLSKTEGSTLNFSYPTAVTWLPDSQQITLVTNHRFITETGNRTITNFDPRTDQNQELFTLNELISGVVSLRWSPDGRQLAYISKSANDNFEVHVVDSTGSNDQIIVPFLSGYKLTVLWSSDGKRIAYTGESKGSGSGIYVVDLASKEQTTVYETANEILGVDWSPDNKRFVYSETDNNRTADARLYLIDANDRNPQQIIFVGVVGTIISISWQPPINEN